MTQVTYEYKFKAGDRVRCVSGSAPPATSIPGRSTRASGPCSSDTRAHPHKRADPLGWPFGALDPRELARRLRERNKQQTQPVYAPAPF